MQVASIFTAASRPGHNDDWDYDRRRGPYHGHNHHRGGRWQWDYDWHRRHWYRCWHWN